MIARVVRGSVTEAVHDGAIAVCDDAGTLIAGQGDVEHPYYMRSVAKPFQATVSQALGADLSPEWMAVACASHGGSPAHVAAVEAMLAGVGLGPDALGCPPAWPLTEAARHRLVAAGHRRARPVWHNCSGKHAAMLRACVSQGWNAAGYLDPGHPLQVRIGGFLAEVLGVTLGEPGIDGCGAPVWATSTAVIATGYARLGTHPELGDAWTAMHRFPALTTSRNGVPLALARWTEVAAKLGAEGVLGISTRRRLGMAIKVWDGSSRSLGPVAEGLADRFGLAAPGTRYRLVAELEQLVIGGGNPVGRIEATVGVS